VDADQLLRALEAGNGQSGQRVWHSGGDHSQTSDRQTAPPGLEKGSRGLGGLERTPCNAG
jgi:hypothetical protein